MAGPGGSGGNAGSSGDSGAPNAGDAGLSDADGAAGAGGGSATVILTASDRIKDLTVDGTSVYFTEGSELASIPKGGGARTPLAAGLNVPVRVTHDTTHVYFATNGDGTVRRVAKDGSGSEVLATPGVVLGLAVEGSDLYFEVSQGAFVVPVTGGTAVAIGTSASARAATVDATTLYRLAVTGRLDRDELQVVPIATGGPSASRTSVLFVGVDIDDDDSTLYYALTGLAIGHTIVSRPKAGGSEALFHDVNPGSLDALDVNDTHLYFAGELDTGAIPEVFAISRLDK